MWYVLFCFVFVFFLLIFFCLVSLQCFKWLALSSCVSFLCLFLQSPPSILLSSAVIPGNHKQPFAQQTFCNIFCHLRKKMSNTRKMKLKQLDSDFRFSSKIIFTCAFKTDVSKCLLRPFFIILKIMVPFDLGTWAVFKIINFLVHHTKKCPLNYFRSTTWRQSIRDDEVSFVHWPHRRWEGLSDLDASYFQVSSMEEEHERERCNSYWLAIGQVPPGAFEHSVGGLNTVHSLDMMGRGPTGVKIWQLF